MEDFLESEEFYNLMQIYRHTPITDVNGVKEAFEKVKAFIREKIKEPPTDLFVTFR